MQARFPRRIPPDSRTPPQPEARKLTTRVKELRLQATLTQEDLARDVGVTRQTIIAIEKGNYVPSVILALKIARRLGSPLEGVFTYE